MRNDLHLFNLLYRYATMDGHTSQDVTLDGDVPVQDKFSPFVISDSYFYFFHPKKKKKKNQIIIILFEKIKLLVKSVSYIVRGV